jgi:hypothetical protein
VITKWKHSSIVAGARTTLRRVARLTVERREQVALLHLGRQAGLGPPRWTLTSTSGISAMTARPRNSVFNARPGPEVIVQAVLPA